MIVYRWDLDKTYLETDFDSLRGLVRSATEPATAKRAVPGATALLRGLCRRPDARVFVLSGSPVQLREVLERKLHLDGIRFDALVLKDSLRMLRKGDVRGVRDQWGHKLPTLLADRRGLDPAAREVLFGDDAEVDALVYTVYAEIVAGRLAGRELDAVLRAARLSSEAAEAARRAAAAVPAAEAVERIFIRQERRVPPARFRALGPRVVPVSSWWQAALVLLEAGHLEPADVAEVLEAVLSRGGLDAWNLAALAQDVVRRGHVSAAVADRVEGPARVVEAVRRAVARLSATRPRPAPPAPGDLAALVRDWRA